MPSKTVEYEVTYILRPHLEEADTEAQISHIADQLRTAGGEVSGDIDRFGKRRLAYEIGDVREGFYVVMRFKSEPPAAKELERLLRLNQNVVRALLLRREEYTIPVPVPVPVAAAVAAPQETADIP
jgi:small subunit ribosomal protein S6